MSTDKNTIKSYDDNAEAWAKRQRTKKAKSYVHLERPAMTAQLPDLSGKAVLCLGCGSGEECQKLKEMGAARVLGTDVSKGLIEQAKYAFPEVEFEVMDMDRISLPPESFDFIYSSLALHYLPSWKGVLAGAWKVLKPGGEFLFSTHHPIRFASETSKKGEITTSNLGFDLSDDEKNIKVHGDYLNSHSIQDQWFDKIKVTYYHRPFSETINEILTAGWQIEKIIEPKPTESSAKLHPGFYTINQKIPLFIIYKLRKG